MKKREANEPLGVGRLLTSRWDTSDSQSSLVPGQPSLPGRLVLGFLLLLGLATIDHASPAAQAGEPVAPQSQASLPVVDKDIDEFYARVDEVVSPTELTVTILDAWDPKDKGNGLRWPGGKAKVQPVKRAVLLEETSVPKDADAQKAAIHYIKTLVQESNNEIVCTGSNVTQRKDPQGEVICVTAYVYVKKGFTINNALVRQGLATTSNPFYKSWQEEAKQKKLGIWRDSK